MEERGIDELNNFYRPQAFLGDSFLLSGALRKDIALVFESRLNNRGLGAIFGMRN